MRNTDNCHERGVSWGYLGYCRSRAQKMSRQTLTFKKLSFWHFQKGFSPTWGAELFPWPHPFQEIPLTFWGSCYSTWGGRKQKLGKAIRHLYRTSSKWWILFLTGTFTLLLSSLMKQRKPVKTYKNGMNIVFWARYVLKEITVPNLWTFKSSALFLSAATRSPWSSYEWKLFSGGYFYGIWPILSLFQHEYEACKYSGFRSCFCSPIISTMNPFLNEERHLSLYTKGDSHSQYRLGCCKTPVLNTDGVPSSKGKTGWVERRGHHRLTRGGH